MTPREEVVRLLADRIAGLHLERLVRIAIDGVTAAGKTTLADELAAVLAQNRPVIRFSIDDYHRPMEERYRRGRLSPEGYYHDAFDYARFLAALQDFEPAPDAFVLVDGVFLLRPEFNDAWDYRVFVEADLEVAYERGIHRDAPWMGGEAEARRRYYLRYIPGERLYLDAEDPVRLADVIIENTVPRAPRLRFRGPDPRPIRK